MKKTLCLLSALLAFPLLSPSSAGDKVFPEKNPVLAYTMPDGWKADVDAKDGSISMNSADGRISVNFAPLPIEASMEIFEKMLPDMLKALGETTVVDKPKEHTEDGLSGFTGTYAAKIEGKPALAILVLFKGGKGHSVLGNIIVAEPETLSKADNEALGNFMKSMKGVAK